MSTLYVTDVQLAAADLVQYVGAQTIDEGAEAALCGAPEDAPVRDEPERSERNVEVAYKMQS